MEKRASREQIVAAVELAGLSLTPALLDELVISYRQIEPSLLRLRQSRERFDEPAHVFDPRKFMPVI